MKKAILIITILTISSRLLSQIAPAPVMDIETEMQAIDGKVSKMKRSGNVYKKTLKQDSPDGKKILFLEGQELKILSVTSKEPLLEKSVQWYFDYGKLIFTEVRWTDIKTKEEEQHDQIYLKNEHIIGWKTLKGRVDPDSQKFKDEDKALNEYAQKIKNER
jgi:hypothetical protein